MSKTVLIGSKEQLENTLRSSRVVVAYFHSPSSAVGQQLTTLYETLSASLSRAQIITFVTIDNDSATALSEQYGIQVVPSFLVFRDGQLKDKVEGANPSELKSIVEKLAEQLQSLSESSGSGTAAGSGSRGGGGGGGSSWSGVDIPRGYSDITDQVEIRNCELLNADEDAGPVKVLFENSKPSALDKGKDFTKDWVQSGSDDQLLLFIPFQATIKVHTLQITSLPDEGQSDVSRPGVIHLYINRPQNMDFSEADDSEPTQIIHLSQEDWNANGTSNIPLRFVKFQRTTTLIIYVQRGDGEADVVRLDRVKLIGETGTKRDMGKLQKVGDEE